MIWKAEEIFLSITLLVEIDMGSPIIIITKETVVSISRMGIVRVVKITIVVVVLIVEGLAHRIPLAMGRVVEDHLPPPAPGNSSGSGKNYSEKKRVIYCFSCKEPGHIKPNCPNRVRRLSPCEDEEDESEMAEPMWVDGWVGDQQIKGIRFDSGCDRTVVDKQFVPDKAYLGKTVVLKGWRGKQRSIHELARITIQVGGKVHKNKKVAVASDMEYPALLGADLNRSMKSEIMKGVLEEWAEESVETDVESEGDIVPAKDAMSSEAVRITRAQSRKEKESEEADAIASAQSGCTPTPLDQIFDFDDDLFLDNTAATSVAELCYWPEVTVNDTQIPIVSDKSTLVEEQMADVTLEPLHELAVKLERGYKYDDGILVQGEEDCLGDMTCRVVVPKGRRQALLDWLILVWSVGILG